MRLHWDIFCRVVDNYGDIGVCWRLARQLVREHGQAVRLWVDNPASLAPLCPACDPALPAQFVQGVELRHWPSEFIVDHVADVVIEAFACELPAAYVALMAVATRRPCWINLEYLSAEAWVEGCHGLTSPQPNGHGACAALNDERTYPLTPAPLPLAVGERCAPSPRLRGEGRGEGAFFHANLPLIKHFFFPGFTSATGGLLREAGLPLAPTPAEADGLEISLFCYDTAPVGDLLAALAASPRPILCHVPPGKPLKAVTAALGPADGWQLGHTRIQPLPFLPLDDYDALLRRCAINFVRGEDSFVRAQWAGRPFVWQIYPQDDAAHHVKLDAFLDCYCAALMPAAATAVRSLFTAWNGGNSGGGDVATAWSAFLAQAPEIARHNANWAQQLARQPDLATNLVNFVAGRV
ncbi:MAG: elongation factor P maturation arginine rhamnosyltransferase EarP [Azonexus sp.]|jgi:hypothetical protein|uniref:elongation factor P maturation arginine rhamnosyltransferase EarP n=1 Tax=Azonexus sp. TaxID=1872668 RepID=UPI00281F4641|nr:elongation factor P maturation arginine rhamnosyltransferase EarP [Azonexus sp.]MDR0775932.1 elongation factor P maturation arginine rhamnosyltransferase EarP [Azonexus sp.]